MQAELYVSLKKQLTNYTNMVFNRDRGSVIMIMKQAIRLPHNQNGGDVDELPDPNEHCERKRRSDRGHKVQRKS